MGLETKTISTSPSTKDKILDAAERLFAERGFAATSVRAITAEAGVNIAALNYHFGSKDALIEAVFWRLFQPVNAERIELLEEVRRDAGEAGPTLEAVLRAYLAPALRLMRDPDKGGRLLVKLLGRSISEPDRFFDFRIVKLFQESFARYMESFQEVLPELAPEELFWRLHFVIGAMAHTMVHTLGHVACRAELCECPAYQQFVPDLSPQELDVEHVLEQLVPFAAAGLRAAASAHPESSP